MRKLQKTSKHYSTATKVKFVVLLPIMCLASVLGNFIDVTAYILRWLFNFIKWNWRQLIVLLVTAFIVATPIVAITRFDQTVPSFKGNTQAEAEHYIYFNGHEMANNFIVAVDGSVRGYVRADERNIDRLIAVVVEYELSDDDKLLGWLIAFKNGDYSDAVAFHNHCWEKLDGEIGYAVDLRYRYK